MDTHFNPTIASQAVHRTYRYGQDKPVYCYQLLTHGTLEEKVYSRCVNKTGLSYLVIDQKAINRNFTERELANLMDTLSWVQCEKCERWRCLGYVSEVGDDLPEEWDCAMNPDVDNNSCENDERDQIWYEQKFSGVVAVDTKTNSKKKKCKQVGLNSTAKGVVDPLMLQLLDLKMRAKNTCIVAKHYLHDNMLKTTSILDDALERSQDDLKHLQEASQSSATDTVEAGSIDGFASIEPETVGLSNNDQPPLTVLQHQQQQQPHHGASCQTAPPQIQQMTAAGHSECSKTTLVQPKPVVHVPMLRAKAANGKQNRVTTVLVEDKGLILEDTETDSRRATTGHSSKDPETSPVQRKLGPSPLGETPKKKAATSLQKKAKSSIEVDSSDAFAPIEKEPCEHHEASRSTQVQNRAEPAVAGQVSNKLEISHVPRKPKVQEEQKQTVSLLQFAQQPQQQKQKSFSPSQQKQQQQKQKSFSPSRGSAFRNAAAPPNARATSPRAQQKDPNKRKHRADHKRHPAISHYQPEEQQRRQYKQQQQHQGQKHHQGKQQYEGRQKPPGKVVANEPQRSPETETYTVGQFREKLHAQAVAVAAATAAKQLTLPQQLGDPPLPTESTSSAPAAVSTTATAAARPRPAVSPVDLPPTKDGVATTTTTTTDNSGHQPKGDNNKNNKQQQEVIDLCDDDDDDDVIEIM
jgi:CW-type Zinc Finger